jgi:hypothetical protein
VNGKLWLAFQLALVGQRLELDFIQGIGTVTDQLPAKDFLVAVEGMDDQTQQLVDLRLEGERLHLRIPFRHLASQNQTLRPHT